VISSRKDYVPEGRTHATKHGEEGIKEKTQNAKSIAQSVDRGSTFRYAPRGRRKKRVFAWILFINWC
jgi:hypothetical protein